MEPVDIPDDARAYYPNSKEISVGPPKGIADEDCGTVKALCGNVNENGGAFDGAPAMRVYYKPNALELELLRMGKAIEFAFYSNVMPVHSVGIIYNNEELAEAERNIAY